MKIKTKITNVTHDDLVNLLSTALYGSYCIGADYSVEDYRSLVTADENDCYEDKMAKLLLEGKPITLSDLYAEDEDDCYGKLPHKWDEENGTMDYEVTLKDIVKGIEKALNNGGRDAGCAMHLIDEDSCELDLTEAENLVQIILFGEALYG